MLPRLFFDHFHSTSLVITDGVGIRAFLVGFRSQSQPHIAYIHFVGVEPSNRKQGLGRRLYRQFFDMMTALGCSEVQCITSPANLGSIAFHKQMGFDIAPSNGTHEGVPCYLNHAANGEHRVCFHRKLFGALPKR
jgi:L-amino acid N-acyltransferase YncA